MAETLSRTVRRRIRALRRAGFCDPDRPWGNAIAEATAAAERLARIVDAAPDDLSGWRELRSWLTRLDRLEALARKAADPTYDADLAEVLAIANLPTTPLGEAE
jgi:hypothetical protein